jgi:hypothetical protein
MSALLVSVCSANAASIEGEIRLQYQGESASANQTFNKEFGDIVKATCDWYAGDFFGEETVFAGVSLKNTGSKPMFVHYYVAFFDKDKHLVGAIGQGTFGDSGLEPGKTIQTRFVPDSASQKQIQGGCLLPGCDLRDGYASQKEVTE